MREEQEEQEEATIHFNMASYESDSIEFDQFELTIEVPFPSQGEVFTAIQSLSPDREPRTGGTIKSLRASANALTVKWNAVEARSLRVSVSSFLDHLALVMETMDAFGQPALQ